MKPKIKEDKLALSQSELEVRKSIRSNGVKHLNTFQNNIHLLYLAIAKNPDLDTPGFKWTECRLQGADVRQCLVS